MTTVSANRPTAMRSQGTPARPNRATGLATSIDPIRVLRRHLLGITLSAIIGAVLGVVAYLALVRIYPQFTDSVLFEVQPGVSQASDVTTNDQTNDEWVFRVAQTETFVLKSVDVLDRALDNPDILSTEWHKQYIRGGTFSKLDARDDLAKYISTSVVRSTNLFSLNWSTRVPTDVPKVLNAISAAYLDLRSARDSSVFQRNLDVFNGRLNATQRDLEDLAEAMKKLIRDNNITSLEDPTKSAQAFKLQELMQQSTSFANELNMSQTSYHQVAQKIEGTMEPTSEDMVMAERDPQMSEIINNIMMVNAALRKSTGERLDDPMIRNLQNTLRAHEETRDARLQEIIRRNLEAQARQLNDDIERYRTSVENLENEIETNNRLMRDITAMHSEYDAMRTRRDHLEARRTADLELINEVQLMRLRVDAGRVKLAQRALPPRKLSFPKPEVIIPLGVLLLVGLTVGIVFLRELMDQRVKSVSDLAVLPGANVLGDIPDLSDDPTKVTAPELVVRRQPMSVLAESYRQAAAVILPQMDRSGHQTLLLVGGLPGAGTTTIATNLAAAASASGKRVLVVDANFRRPRLAEAMGVANGAIGLGDVLVGSASLNDCIVDAGDGVSVMSAGTPANRMIDRVNSAAFDSLIAQLRSSFDLVIFDAPPAVVAGDAMLLANKVDAAVLVVRAQQEHRGLVLRMMNKLADTRCELLGVLLNRPRGVAGGYLKKNYAAMAEYGVNQQG